MRSEGDSGSRMYLAVAAGSAVGALLRHGTAAAAARHGAAAFPLATLAVNVAGSFLIGFFATVSGPEGRTPVGPMGRQFMMAGLCGGLTTFSIFSLETVRLLEDGRGTAATLYVTLSFLLWVPSAWLGHVLARHLNERRPSG